MTATMAERPSIGAGLRRMVVIAPSRISPTPSGRSGMTPGLTTGGGTHPHRVPAGDAGGAPQPPGGGVPLPGGDPAGPGRSPAAGARSGAAQSGFGGWRVDQPGYGGSPGREEESSSSGLPQPGVSDMAISLLQVRRVRSGRPSDRSGTSCHEVSAAIVVAPHSDPRSFLARVPRCSIFHDSPTATAQWGHEGTRARCR